MMLALTLMASLNNSAMISGAIPSERQLAWHKTELYTLIHFGPNTFTGNEWGHGTEKPELFNPKQFDARQWAKAIKAGGFKGIVMVAKHHDGFCLWPSKYSTHTVRESSWKDGKGDILAEVAAACRAEGLKLGFYLSPWDRNHPSYGTGEKYNEIYRRQQDELMTNYGELFMFWFDGANGEGPNGKKQIYDWPSFWNNVREKQPNACMFSDVGPDVRWVGNESGWAGETNWSTFEIGSLGPGNGKATEINPYGMEGGSTWLPAECDVPLRPGWFWRSSEDSKVRSLSWMVDTYFKSVGRGAGFNLGLAPDDRGLLHENDVARLAEFGKWLKTSFKTDHLKGGKVEPAAAASLLTEDKGEWLASVGGSVEVTLKKPDVINTVSIQELIAKGQNIKGFEVWVNDGGWKKVGGGTTIGYKRLIRFDDVKASGVKVVITDSLNKPILSRVQAFKVAATP